MGERESERERERGGETETEAQDIHEQRYNDLPAVKSPQPVVEGNGDCCRRRGCVRKRFLKVFGVSCKYNNSSCKRKRWMSERRRQ